jgi:hypothetical protein
MSEVALARETFDQVVEDARPLLEANNEEVQTIDAAELALHEDLYRATEKAGALHIYTLRVDGKLAGYSAYIAGPHLHFRDKIVATQDAFYVAPEHRTSTKPLALLRYAERMLTACGVAMVMQSSNVKRPAFGRLLELSGYAPLELVWSKKLEAAHGAV